VQVLPVGHGALLPTVQGITGGWVGGGSMHSPPQGRVIVAHTSVGVHVHRLGHGALFPMVQGIVYFGGGPLLVVCAAASIGSRPSRIVVGKCIANNKFGFKRILTERSEKATSAAGLKSCGSE
jgi:hypothetical protein